ncbi:MAG: nitrilase-related carbon-nitrogen hydrolase [Microthrixaceae bacterium]
MVLPEFGNHYSIYESEEHAWEVATDTTDPDDPFVRALSAAAGDHGIWVVANSTVRRDGEGDRPGQRRITVTQLLFSPEAGLVGEGDKQVLMGAERTFLSGGDTPGCVMDTPLGRIGLYCCMDGVISEPARSLAVRGAEILCNSLNSFALDEASLHVPARAAENGVWVVACCKVGPLIPDDRRQEIASAVGLPESTFTAAGESQIVSPTGAVVAKAPRRRSGGARRDRSRRSRGAHRPDGTSLLGLRRPELYLPVAQDVRPLPPTGAEPFGAAVISEGCGEPDRLAERVRQLGSAGARLIVLPELAASDRGTLEGDPESAARAGTHLLGVLRTALAGTDSLVVTSVVEEHADGGYSHVGLAVSAEGVALHQPALHVPERHRSWQTDLGERIKVVTTGFGRLALLVGDDLLVPEAARLAVLGGAEVVASPFSVATSYDLALIAPSAAPRTGCASRWRAVTGTSVDRRSSNRRGTLSGRALTGRSRSTRRSTTRSDASQAPGTRTSRPPSTRVGPSRSWSAPTPTSSGVGGPSYVRTWFPRSPDPRPDRSHAPAGSELPQRAEATDPPAVGSGNAIRNPSDPPALVLSPRSPVVCPEMTTRPSSVTVIP